MDDLMQMAKQANGVVHDEFVRGIRHREVRFDVSDLAEFARLIRADERRLCVDRCEVVAHKYLNSCNHRLSEVADECKDEIRRMP